MKVREPKTILPANYVPTGCVPHRIKDGESWMSIAASIGVDPWWLIQYNFETRDPAEVNWYLKNRVGCVRTTLDKRNFIFSQSASPGLIHVPTPQAAMAFKTLDFKLYGIVIEGDEDYRNQVALTLKLLARSDTGMILLQALQRTGRTIEISAWMGTDCNATAGAVNDDDAAAAGAPVYKGDGTFDALKEPHLIRELLGLPLEGRYGTGKGSDSKVHFSPTMFGYGASGACARVAGLPGSSPSQVLFHELAHAYRQANGAFNRRPTVGGSANYTDMEEFFAVVLSNVLTSDPTYSTGNRALRADHAGFTTLAPTQSTSHGFVAHKPNHNKMRELVASEPRLTAALQRVNSSFNPFKEPL